MEEIFEQAISYPNYPNLDYRERFHELVGLDDYKEMPAEKPRQKSRKS